MANVTMAEADTLLRVEHLTMRFGGLVGTREPSAFYQERRTILGSFVKEGHG